MYINTLLLIGGQLYWLPIEAFVEVAGLMCKMKQQTGDSDSMDLVEFKEMARKFDYWIKSDSNPTAIQ